MSKATVTYHAPEGDNAVVTFFGVRFFDGQPQEFDGKDHGALIAKAHRNPHFAVSMSGAAASDPVEPKPADAGDAAEKPDKRKKPKPADAGET